MARIIYRPEFDQDCLQFGGIWAVHKVLSPLEDAILRNPNAFGFLEVNSGIRFARIKAVGNMPETAITFTVEDDGDVMMLSISKL